MANDVTAEVITTGQSLKDRCRTVQVLSPSAGLACRGYIGAVADILAEGDTIAGYRACPPLRESREILVKNVRDWLDDHPEALELRASRAAARALTEIYPCDEP